MFDKNILKQSILKEINKIMKIFSKTNIIIFMLIAIVILFSCKKNSR